MTTFKIIFLALCVLILGSCQFDEPGIETSPTETIIHLLEHEFVIRGNIDGEEFEIKHEGFDNFNTPNNGEPIFFHTNDYFGTSFIVDTPENRNFFLSRFVFGISKDDSAQFDDVMKIGRYSWYDRWNGITNQGNALVHYDPDHNTNDQLWSNAFPRERNPDDYFEITNITLIETSENLSSNYEGNLYKVEGHFEVDMQDFTQENSRLKVDYFSAIFVGPN